jgi:hypothetical protein
MLLRIEVSVGGNWNADLGKFRRRLKVALLEQVAQIAEATDVEVDRVQVIHPRKKAA